MGGKKWGKGMRKGRNEGFWSEVGFVKWIRGIVNGELIHANRLAFGWTEVYLCIEAASGQMVSQASWHERQEEASG